MLGEFEQIVLLALIRLGADAYGMTVRREIEERTGRNSSIGAVYATLDRLEKKGLLKSRLGDPTPERGGRAKRIFVITAAGRKALQSAQEAFAKMREGVSLA